MVAVDFVNVPSWVVARDVPVSTSRGDVRVTVAYGGAIYASLPASQLDLAVTPEHLGELIGIGREVKWALNDSPHAVHPSDPRLDGIYGTIWFDDLGDVDGQVHQRNVTVFADGEVDRSPCGSGTCARLAVLADDGRLARRCDAPARLHRREHVHRDGAGHGRGRRARGGPPSGDRDGLSHRRARLHDRSARSAGPGFRAAMRFLDADAVAALGPARASQAIVDALRGGLDPSADPARVSVPLSHGQFLLMPSEARAAVGVKVVTIAPGNADRGLPRIQAAYLLFDQDTLALRAVLDGTALTTLRTPAVSVATVLGHLPDGAMRVAVIGAGHRQPRTSQRCGRPRAGRRGLPGPRPLAHPARRRGARVRARGRRAGLGGRRGLRDLGSVPGAALGSRARRGDRRRRRLPRTGRPRARRGVARALDRGRRGRRHCAP